MSKSSDYYLDELQKAHAKINQMSDSIADAIWTLREILHQTKFSSNLQGLVEQKIAKLETMRGEL